MTAKEFEDKIGAFKAEQEQLAQRLKESEEAEARYRAEAEKIAFDQSGYRYGQKIEIDGRVLYVGGAWSIGRSMYLKLFRPKKDGTMSKRISTGWGLKILK